MDHTRPAADCVPGALRCARCGLRLQALVLNPATGLFVAVESSPTNCPNGCGPLWALTWGQEARDCWRQIGLLQADAETFRASHQAADAGWRREASDLDDVLRLVGLAPDDYRTDGGNLMLAKVARAVREKGLDGRVGLS